ncbi:hypothetical protein C7974DRAFT_392717 [Boeremia exigua]|uniref:uncharacterized protein n=1 Tax=Boeremia exigua TaxID=749465 RepID=UPI001E8E610E|nr:uncharacterized protein C7974DRAFT_392717 [Boeremia exigua]KAH6633404.1 hypothetical protein C7974DRAFT_392717 [Boeremia exigua]
MFNRIDNPRGEQAFDTSVAFSVIAFVSVVLRLYTRWFIVRAPGIEDHLILVATLCSICLTIAIAYQVKWGMGMHSTSLSAEDNVKVSKAFWASLIVYYLSLGLTKSSLLLQYHRVFPTRKFRLMCWCVFAVVIAYTVWTVFGSIFACVPVRAFWTKEDAYCLDQFAMWFTNAAINIVTDFVIILLPMPVIRRLQLGKRQKSALIGIFAVGGFVCIVSILRLQSLVAISNSTDQSYDNPAAATWSSVEANVGIICSCLPLLRPLMTKWLPGVFSSHRRDTRSTPRIYPTIGTARSRPLASHNGDISLETTAKASRPGSHGSSDIDAGDIQVETHIHIKVEGGGDRFSGWATPESKGRDGRDSTDTLVKESRSAV